MVIYIRIIRLFWTVFPTFTVTYIPPELFMCTNISPHYLLTLELYSIKIFPWRRWKRRWEMWLRGKHLVLMDFRYWCIWNIWRKSSHLSYRCTDPLLNVNNSCLDQDQDSVCWSSYGVCQLFVFNRPHPLPFPPGAFGCSPYSSLYCLSSFFPHIHLLQGLFLPEMLLTSYLPSMRSISSWSVLII